MNSMKDRHPLEGHLSDYLNDHLSEQDRVRFEEALREDASLQDMLALERRIQAECQKTTGVEQLPRFEAFEHKLESKGLGDRLREPVWAAAAALVAVALLIGIQLRQPDIGTDFETLSEQSEPYEGTVLRVVMKQDQKQLLNELASDYDLSVVELYSAAGAIDVRVDGNESASALVQQLQRDPRVRFVNKVAGQ